MRKLIEIVSSALTATSMLALALGCALLSRYSWAAEPLSAGSCDGCHTNYPYCGPCPAEPGYGGRGGSGGGCIETGTNGVCDCSCVDQNRGKEQCPGCPCYLGYLYCCDLYECDPNS
jgi:hypothetical protein